MLKGGMIDLSHLARPGARLAVRVTPRASRNAVAVEGEGAGAVIRIHTNAPPADGAANAAVRRLLAKALGVAPSRLTLERGAASRDKLFRLDQP